MFSAREKNRSASVSKMFLFLVIAVLIFAQPSYAYKKAQHIDICSKGITLCHEYQVNERTSDYCPGVDALAGYSTEIILGSWNEDETTWTEWAPFMNHFYDEDTGLGLLWLGIRFDSAKVKAIDYFLEYTLPLYADKQYSDAYEYLGKVIHLAVDMSVPAHVHLDPHPPSQADWYEAEYATTYCADTDTNILYLITSLNSLFDALSDKTDNYDSGTATGTDGVQGEEDYGTRSAQGFVIYEGNEIRDVCYKQAISSVGGILRYFYKTVRPSVLTYGPGYDSICSGLNGVPFSVLGAHYEQNYDAVGYLDRATFYKSESPGPPGNDWQGSNWEEVASSTSIDSSFNFRSTWTNSINNEDVWIGILLWDEGNCESNFFSHEISIDSTKPTITGTGR